MPNDLPAAENGVARRRLLLLIALVPLALLAWLLARWEAAHVMCVAFSPDGKSLATVRSTGGGDRESVITVWDVPTRRELFRERRSDPVHRVAFAPDGQMLAAGGWDGSVTVWDAATGRVEIRLQSHEVAVFPVAFSPDGRFVAAGCSIEDFGSVKLWELATGQARQTLYHGGGVYSLAFSPDGHTLAVAGLDPPVRLWDTQTGEPRSAETWFANSMRPVAFFPDGRHVVTGTRAGRAAIWRADTGQPLLTINDPKVWDFSLSPNGELLATGGGWDDTTARVWHTATGSKVASLAGHSATVFSVRFSPDGQRIATGGWDGTVRLWSTASWQQEAIRHAPAKIPWQWLGLVALVIALPSWAFAWVRAGALKPRPTRALRDLLLVTALLLGGLALRVWSVESTMGDGRPAALFMFAVLAAWVSLLVFWLVFGSGRWSLRATGAVAGYAIVWTVPLLLWHWNRDWLAWQFLVAGVMQTAGLLILFGVPHWLGVRVRLLGDEAAASDLGRPVQQFSLRDLILWIAAAASLLAVCRFARPVDMPFREYGFLALSGVCVSAVAGVAVWVALGTTRLWRRIAALVAMALIAAIALAGSLGYAARFRAGGLYFPLWWYVCFAPLAGLFLAASLCVFRMYGYRLTSRACLDRASPAAK